MSESLILQTVEAWRQRGALYTVHFRHKSDHSLQFIHGYYDDHELSVEKFLWKRRGYIVVRQHVLI